MYKGFTCRRLSYTKK